MVISTAKIKSFFRAPAPALTRALIPDSARQQSRNSLEHSAHVDKTHYLIAVNGIDEPAGQHQVIWGSDWREYGVLVADD